MSGGHFYTSPHEIGHEYCGEWRDEELNAMFFDLFGGGYDGWRSPYTGSERKAEFGRTWYGNATGGLAEALDLCLSGDIDEEDYREQVQRFKDKWLVRKTPKNRVEFYQMAFKDYAEDLMEKMAKELANGSADSQASDRG